MPVAKEKTGSDSTSIQEFAMHRQKCMSPRSFTMMWFSYAFYIPLGSSMDPHSSFDTLSPTHGSSPVNQSIHHCGQIVHSIHVSPWDPSRYCCASYTLCYSSTPASHTQKIMPPINNNKKKNKKKTAINISQASNLSPPREFILERKIACIRSDEICCAPSSGI